MNWNLLSEKSCAGEELSREEALSVLNCRDESFLALLDAAYKVRMNFFGKRVKLNFLVNAKSGLCPEDCFYCSQSKVSKADIDQYPFLTDREILLAASRAVATKAKRLCIVNSGRGPTENEIGQISTAVKKVREEFPQLEICACLGLLQPDQACALKNSGVYAYNHNLNTSENHYSKICSTHTYQDRIETIQAVKEANLSPCSGCLLGMGEDEKDILDLAFTLRRMGVDSIPINFLIPIDGTPLSNKNELTPMRCLKILCLFRFLNPKSEIRIAGGREVNLRWLQPLGLYVANSIFIGDYLTTKGQDPKADLAMIHDLGFEIEGYDHPFLEKSEAHSDQSLIKQEEFSVRLK